MRVFTSHHLISRAAATLMLALAVFAVAGCAQIGIPIENHTDSGNFDQTLPVEANKLRDELERYLRARNLLESVHSDAQGNHYLHQNWVQSPSLRYYQLAFDQRHRHLSEWKVVWYIEPSPTDKASSKIRIAVLELLYLGDPSDKIRAPKEADGNWVETDLDRERAKLLFADFTDWQKSGKLNKMPRYLQSEELDFAPKSRTEIRRSPPFTETPYQF